MPQQKTKEITKRQVIENIIKNIKKECDKTKDAPGIILIPAYRNTKQLYSDESQPGGLFSNVTNVHLLQLAIANALDAYAQAPNSEKIQVDGIDCDNTKEQVALILAGALSASLADVDDVVRHLCTLCANVLKNEKLDRELTMSILPSDCEKGFHSATKNSGMVATANPDQQEHLFATMILAYCIKNRLDIETFMNNIFGHVMTADIKMDED